MTQPVKPEEPPTSDAAIEPTLIPPDVATLIPYTMARRLPAVAVSATAGEVTVLMASASDASAVAEIEAVTGCAVNPVETPREQIETLLDHLSGSLNTDDLWLQQRHIAALGRLVDHGVNVGKLEVVRPLVERALEFTPYSAEVWLMKARVSAQRKDVVDALKVAAQIAPNDRRVLRWIQSMQDFGDPSPTVRVDPESEPRAADLRREPSVAPSERVSTVPVSSPMPGTGAPVVLFEPIPIPAPARPTTAPGSAIQSSAPEMSAEGTVTLADAAFQAARELSTIRDVELLTKRTAECLQAMTHADSVSTYVSTRRGWVGWSTSPDLRSRMVEVLPKENRLAAQVVRQQLPIVITDTALRSEDVGPLVREFGIQSFALLPMPINGAIGGLVYLNFHAPERANDVFDPEVGRGIELVLNCAGNAAGASAAKGAQRPSASLDALTHAYTHEQFERLLNAEVERARRYRFSVSLLSLDIDDFTTINDHYGRTAGDEVLKQVAATARSQERASDVLCRRGDDEFVVMLPQTTSKGAAIVARRLQRALAPGIPVSEGRIPATVSIGVATFPEQADDSARLLNATEMALYAAKEEAKRKQAPEELAP